MKLCPSCYKRNDNYADFCKRCNASLAGVPITEDFLEKAGNFLDRINGTANLGPKGGQQVSSGGTEEAQQTVADNAVNAQQIAEGSAENATEHHQEVAAKKAAWEFIDPSETVRAELSAGFVQSMLTGDGIEKNSAVLTEKRIYYKGQLFSGAGKGMISRKGEYIIPVEDISMTNFIHDDAVGALFAAFFGVCLILASWALFDHSDIAGVVALFAGIFTLVCGILVYAVKKSTIFEISFPGGRFCFDIKLYPIAAMREFQRQIHLAKDNLKAAQNAKNKAGQGEQA